MHYIIYKITNNLNGKIYVGLHATEDLNDGYMGSGVNIRKAIKKYGVENFTKEILHELNSREEMYAKEAEIVNEAFVNATDTYNAAIGGYGRPYDITERPELRAKISERTSAGMTKEARAKVSAARKAFKSTEETKGKIGSGLKAAYASGIRKSTKGSKLSEEHKAKIRANSNKGKRFVLVDITIKGKKFNYYDDAAEHFGVSGATIRNWIKETRPQYADCYKL